MEIQNFQKFLVRPIVLEILDFFEILDFLKFWYVVTTESPLFNKLLIKSLYKIISGHVFRIRDLIDFYVFVYFLYKKYREICGESGISLMFNKQSIWSKYKRI